MTVDLRPLTVGEIVDRAIRIYRRNFLVLAGIAAIQAIPMGILEIMLQVNLAGSSAQTLSQQGLGLLDSLIGYWIIGGLMIFIARSYLEDPTDMGSALGASWGRYGSVFGAHFMQGLAVILPAIVIGLVIALGGIVGLIFGGGALICLASVLGTRWAVCIPIVLLEPRSATESLSRSWALTDHGFWRILGINLLATALILVIAGIPAILISTLLEQFLGNPFIAQVAQTVATQLITLVTVPIGAAVTVILYYDLLVRKEGFDLELQVKTLSMNGQ